VKDKNTKECGNIILPVLYFCCMYGNWRFNNVSTVVSFWVQDVAKEY